MMRHEGVHTGIDSRLLRAILRGGAMSGCCGVIASGVIVLAQVMENAPMHCGILALFGFATAVWVCCVGLASLSRADSTPGDSGR